MPEDATDRMLMTSPAVADRASRLVFVLVALAIYPRLFFGVEFFDGAYYIALPYSFELGHRPFSDESAIHQMAALLTWPLVDLHLRIVGSTDWLVLFSRHLYFAASLASAGIVRHVLARFFAEPIANLVAIVPLAYIPFCIPDLSYNTIAHLGLLSGSFLLASAIVADSPGRRVAAGTAAFALAAFAYPPVVLALAPALAFALFQLHRVCGGVAGREGLRAAGATVGVAIVLGGGLLLALGLPGELARIVEFSQSQAQQGGGLAKLTRLGREFQLESRYFGILAIALTTIIGLHCALRSARLALAVSLLLGPALYFAGGYYVKFTLPMITTPFVISALALAAPPLLFATRHRLAREAWTGLVIVATTSFLAGGVILWATANGLRNAALGFLPAALVTLVCLPALVRHASRPVGARAGGVGVRTTLAFGALVASLLVFQIQQLWGHFYREHPVWKQNEVVTSGAWRGIRTTEGKKHFVESLQQDLALHRGDAKTVLFFDHFPGGYLASDLKPSTPALWIFPSKKMFQGTLDLRRVYARKFASDESLPDLVVRMSCVPAQLHFNVVTPPDDPLALRFHDDDYRRVAKRRCYEILARRPTQDSPERGS
jgi:hypothetical protein